MFSIEISDETMRAILAAGVGYSTKRIKQVGDPTNGGYLEVVDAFGEGVTGRIRRWELQRGLNILAERHPRLLGELISGRWDSSSADALVQAAAFGEVLYG